MFNVQLQYPASFVIMLVQRVQIFNIANSIKAIESEQLLKQNTILKKTIDTDY